MTAEKFPALTALRVARNRKIEQWRENNPRPPGRPLADHYPPDWDISSDEMRDIPPPGVFAEDPPCPVCRTKHPYMIPGGDLLCGKCGHVWEVRLG